MEMCTVVLYKSSPSSSFLPRIEGSSFCSKKGPYYGKIFENGGISAFISILIWLEFG